MVSKIPVFSCVLNCGNTPLITSSWLEVVESLPYAVSSIEVYNGSTTPFLIGVGKVSEELSIPYTIMGGGTNGAVKISIGASERVSLKPIDSNISDGFVVINFFTEVN